MSWITPLIAVTTLGGSVSGGKDYWGLGMRNSGTVMVPLRGRSKENVRWIARATAGYVRAKPPSLGDERFLLGRARQGRAGISYWLSLVLKCRGSRHSRCVII